MVFIFSFIYLLLSLFIFFECQLSLIEAGTTIELYWAAKPRNIRRKNQPIAWNEKQQDSTKIEGKTDLHQKPHEQGQLKTAG